MRPLIAVWPEALAFWAVYAWAFWPEIRLLRRAQRRLAQTPEPADADAAPRDRSLRLLMMGQYIALGGAFVAAFLLPRFALHQREGAFWAGLAVIIAGSLLRRHCFRMLGPSFTADVQARPEQVVVERGAYRWIRHPSYTAGFLMFVGIGLAFGNWLSLAFLVAGIVAVYGYRVPGEEQTLVATIGEPYRAYLARTKRFVPFLF